MPPIQRPSPTEHAHYYEKYTSLVPEGDILQILKQQLAETSTLLRTIPESKGNHRYVEGKWSIKEVIGHINDAERCFSNRAFCFARADKAPLPSFEQDDYVRGGDFDKRTLTDLIEEFETIRNATLSLFSSLNSDQLLRRGIASDNPFTVRALAFIIAGHELHHRKILRERYL